MARLGCFNARAAGFFFCVVPSKTGATKMDDNDRRAIVRYVYGWISPTRRGFRPDGWRVLLEVKSLSTGMVSVVSGFGWKLRFPITDVRSEVPQNVTAKNNAGKCSRMNVCNMLLNYGLQH